MAHVNTKDLPILKRLNWVNTIFLIVSPLLVIVFLPLHLIFEGLDWRLLAMCVFFFFATGISITAGYHRLFAHRSYEASLPVKLFYLIFGAAALQGSVSKWASDHRRHHRHVDNEEDPYNVSKGFFYAHMGWVFFKDDPKYRDQRAPDLVADKWIAWQDKYHFPIAINVGFLLPTLLGLMFDSPWGGLLYGCLVRVVLTHHTTFFINSLCHMWGSQPYTDKNSAKDSFILAFFTHGEGYHNFHHKFEADYRNGIRWYHWDPTKWWIKSLSWVGLAKNLRKISDFEILKAKLLQQEKQLMIAGIYNDQIKELRLKVEEAQKKILYMKNRYQELKREVAIHRDQKVAQFRSDLERLQTEIKQAQREFRAAVEQWQAVYQNRALSMPF